jgi:hypothetical protein
MITPVLPVSFTGHRTLVKDIVLHGVTDPSDPNRDIDFDGLPDLWEDQYFGNGDAYTASSELVLYSAGDDPDGDRCPNGCEQVRGSDPLDPDSDSNPNGIAGAGGDGLLDGAEAYTYLTDPMKADTDSDCLRDDLEVNPDIFTAQGFIPTNPRLNDTDGDGLLDGEEMGQCAVDLNGDGTRVITIIPSTNPNMPDSDGDGLTDLQELRGFNIIDYGLCELNPSDSDTDGDLTFDNDELTLGRNPCYGEPTTIRIEEHTSVSESSEFAVFTIVEDNPVYNPDLPITVTIDYETRDESANADSDYWAANGTLTFTAPSSPTLSQSLTIAIRLQDDNEYEAEQAFSLVLFNPVNATVTGGTTSKTVTIIDDDSIPAVSIQGPDHVAESALSVSFNITLSNPSSYLVTAYYNTTDGTAEAGLDYTTTSRAVVFEPGSLSKTIDVPIRDDQTDEADETFTLSLVPPPTNAVAGTTSALVTIIDDDNPPTLSIHGPVIGEESSDALVFEVTLLPETTQTITVAYTTADETAVAESDYSTTSDLLTFEPGTVSKMIRVPILPDTTDEADETFIVSLIAPVSGALIGTDTAIGTIIDDDAPPTISIAESGIGAESDTSVAFEVTLSAMSEQTITVGYMTADGTAVAGSDYNALRGFLTFEPGTLSRMINVDIVPDSMDEADESFTVSLIDPANNAVLGTTLGRGTIMDDDPPPTVSIGPSRSVTEGDDPSTTTLSFDVILSAQSAKTISVDYTSGNGTATPGTDYDPVDGTLTFSAGETSKTISVIILGDAVDEADETFSVSLADPVTNAVMGTVSASGTIRDDDNPPEVMIQGEGSIIEGNTTTTGVFYITLAQACEQTISVFYSLESDSTALNSASADDYIETTGQLTFEPGEISKTIYVDILGDTISEPDESFMVTVANSSQGIQTTKTVTIVNDDWE